MQASIDNSTRYLEEESTTCTADDRRLLLDAVACARVVLDSGGWKALSRSHELGLYVDQWPSESAGTCHHEILFIPLAGASEVPRNCHSPLA